MRSFEAIYCLIRRISGEDISGGVALFRVCAGLLGGEGDLKSDVI